MTFKPMLLALTLTAACSPAASAQTASPPVSPTATPPSMPTVPTTRVLAVGHFTKGTSLAMVAPVMKDEVPATLKLYLDGTLDQFFFRTDGGGGIVFLLNVKTVDEARTILDGLPLSQHHYMEFDVIPLGPLAPFARLLKPAS